MTARLPVIDISPLLKAKGESSIYASDVVMQIDKAFRDIGLFYITGHGVPQNLTDGIMDAAKRFFEMPLEKKKALSIRNSKGYRGYIEKSSEKSGGKVDLKEGIYFGPDVSSDDPDVISGTPMAGVNQFPDERDLPNFANVVKQYRNQMTTVGLSLMRAIAMGLQLKEDYFDDMFSNPSAFLALWSYPANTSKEESYWAWPHTDPEVITMIFQDDVGGLEVQLPDSGKWIAVPPVPGALVVNGGDSLEAWTKGLYRAGVHRVKSSPGKGRFSAPLFLGPSLKSIIEPLDIDLTREIDYSPESLRRKLPCTYGEYYSVSFQTSYDWFKG